MRTERMRNRLGRAALCAILLLAGLLGNLRLSRPHEVRAGGLVVEAFYATKAGGTPTSFFEQWCNINPSCGSPPVVRAYPAGQAVIDLFYDTNYPAPNILDMQPALDRFALVIRTSTGAVFERCLLHATSSPTCNYNHARSDDRTYYHQGMIEVWAPQQQGDTQASAFRNDSYRAEVLVDGHLAAHTTFRVGSGHPATKPQPPSPTAIVAFYPTTETTYSSWTDFGGTPPKTTTLSSGQTALYFYLRWAGLASTLPVYILVSALGHSDPMGTRGPIPLASPSGSFMYIVVTPDRSPFNNGPYTATVQAGDKVIARVTFRIGS